MQIQVSGKHMDVGEALTTYVNEHLNSAVGKYFDRPVEAHVTFSKDGHEFVANTMVHLATGMIAKASGHNDDVYASFDAALSKMEKQLRRYKRRLKNHHKDRIDPIESIGAPTFVIETPKEDEEPENLQAAHCGRDGNLGANAKRRRGRYADGADGRQYAGVSQR